MKRSNSKNKFNKGRNVNWSDNKQQRNYYSNLLKESKTHQINNLNVKDVTENKRFWKTIKTFFTDKTKNSDNIILPENFETMREDEKICEIFNTYFTNVNKDLTLRQIDKTQSFKNEKSCGLIKEHFGNGSFSFKPVSKNDVISAIKKLPLHKASISNDIPASVMKQFAKCYCEKLTNILNDCLKENRLPNFKKVAEISPVFKKLDNTTKDN